MAQGRGANGAAINYGSGGNGTTSHLAMELLKPFMQSELERWGKAVKASGATMS